MDRKTKNKVIRKLSAAMPWYNDKFIESVLNEVVKNPKIKKEELAWIKIKVEDRVTPIDIANEYVASKYISIIKEEIGNL